MQLLFHPFNDIIAITDGFNVGIWSTEGGARLININCSNSRIATNNSSAATVSAQNDHRSTLAHIPASSASVSMKHLSSGRSSLHASQPVASSTVAPAASKITSGAFNPVISGKVTSMQWINETYESLLMVGIYHYLIIRERIVLVFMLGICCSLVEMMAQSGFTEMMATPSLQRPMLHIPLLFIRVVAGLCLPLEVRAGTP